MEQATAGGPPAAGGQPDADERFEKRFEIVLAVLLGLAAIATAFAAYMTDLRDGDALKNFQEGVRVADQASQQVNLAAANRNEDQIVTTFALQAVVNATFEASSQGGEISDEDANDFGNTLINEIGSEELKAANKQCNEDPECEVPPIDSDYYKLDADAEADRLDKQADTLFAEANDNDQTGDTYGLATVILATALFLYGVAAVASARVVKLSMSGAGVAIFLISLGILIGA